MGSTMSCFRKIVSDAFFVNAQSDCSVEKPFPTEDIQKKNPNRFTLFPIKHQDIWKFYKKHVDSFWVAEEIDLSTDLRDWNDKLSENERFFITQILAFFVVSDGIVLENLLTRFMSDVQYPEARCFYGFQIAMENVHSEVYSLLIDTYVQDPVEKHKLFHAIETMPIIKSKTDWAIRWLSSDLLFAERLLAFAIIEGVFFCGSFCAIFWLKKRNLMKGMAFSNEFISRDESLHCEFATLLYKNHVHNKPDDKRVYEIIGEAVELETDFITNSIKVEMIGMNSELMCEYIKYVADHLLQRLGHPKLYGASNPFDFMEMISLPDKSNFFEKKVSAYRKNNVRVKHDGTVGDFRIDAEF